MIANILAIILGFGLATFGIFTIRWILSYKDKKEFVVVRLIGVLAASVLGPFFIYILKLFEEENNLVSGLLFAGSIILGMFIVGYIVKPFKNIDKR